MALPLVFQPPAVHLKSVPVAASGVVIRHVRRLQWKGIDNICVDRDAMPLTLPIAGYRNLLAPGHF